MKSGDIIKYEGEKYLVLSVQDETVCLVNEKHIMNTRDHTLALSIVRAGVCYSSSVFNVGDEWVFARRDWRVVAVFSDEVDLVSSESVNGQLIVSNIKGMKKSDLITIGKRKVG